MSLGFIPDIIKEEDYIFGASKLPNEVLVPNGDWRPYLPALEVQRKAFDTYSCVSFANNNVCEMIHLKRYGTEINYSDRFLSVVSETVPGRGNSHNKVAEARRKKGCVLEHECPFPENMSQQVFFSPIKEELLKEGLKWVETYEYGYERVDKSKFKQALKYSPIQVAVDSRTNKTSNYQSPDHSVVLVAIDSKARIFDSYQNRHEAYDLDYPFSFGLRHHYKRKLTLNADGMHLQLIKGDRRPEIYLLDFDGVKHHIELMPDLEELFGKNAKWIEMHQEDVNKIPEGVSLSARKINFIEKLKEEINKLGIKI